MFAPSDTHRQAEGRASIDQHRESERASVTAESESSRGAGVVAGGRRAFSTFANSSSPDRTDTRQEGRKQEAQDDERGPGQEAVSKGSAAAP